MRSQIVRALGSVALFTLGTVPAVAETDHGWRLKLTGVSVQSTASDAPNGDAGAGLGLEYRVSRHIGVELDALTSELEDSQTLGFFALTLETSLKVTPVLARLNLHLTPGHPVDFYLGPVVGWMRYGDIEIRFRGGDFPSDQTFRVPTRDTFAWGGHFGVDLPLGARGLFLTGGATYLKAEVETKPDDFVEPGSFDLDPLIAHLGVGYRF